MTRTADHVHRTQPAFNLGFPGFPGYPALPAAAEICYSIADGCAACLDAAIDDASDDVFVCSALVAYTAEILAVTHAMTTPVPTSGREPFLPEGLGTEPTKPGAPIPGPAFVAAATAAFDACPATCAGNGVPAAQHVLSRVSPDERIKALSDAAALLAVYQPRTERGRNALKALSMPL
ncbi:hypothetical protein KDK95_01355 [Actinospica sp. MGRD01-02]|uniref:Uncharacterized protein n=1 Tax=Actinospica acidithermotolerans TaxID=2828514 RepID=A0A941IIN6_9ACTN|nr:hypothetical protein [Actinospica acidithermotolerans]MBR7824936.1 hypothetical protein [Actinospica acidithermotolerans]